MHEGGPLGPPFCVLSHRNFGTELAPYVYAPETTIYQQKEQSKNISFQNGGQKTNFVSRKKSCDQNWKNYFPDGMETRKTKSWAQVDPPLCT